MKKIKININNLELNKSLYSELTWHEQKTKNRERKHMHSHNWQYNIYEVSTDRANYFKNKYKLFENEFGELICDKLTS